MEMADLLADLEGLIAALPDRAHFRPPASPETVAAVEQAIGRAVPPDYALFLLRHDGGFIGADPIPFGNDEAFGHERWNANHLHGCAELIREHADTMLLARDVEPDLTDWPYLPFCHTDAQELLVFGPPGPDGAHPVLDAFHEVGPREWGVLATGFADFLRRYIDDRGFPQTIAGGVEGNGRDPSSPPT